MINHFIFLAENIVQKIEMSNVGWVDVVFILFAFWALIVGYRAGLAKEFSKFFAVLTGLFLTFHYTEPLGIWIKRNSFIPPDIAEPLTYLVLLIVSIVVVYTIMQFLGKLFEIRVFQLLEKTGGMIFALARYALILGLITHFIYFFPMPMIQDSFTKSITGPYLISVCPKTYKGLSKIIPLPKLRFEPQVTVQ